ncbi:TIGR03085 family metal-binding protein [Amycolatopsis minnesotensis]|uniref:TIGR03085 family metal-binding protein n=1 Tax=Amycolatopsis minnesotensis TaxID=337894 RepID=A0ABN2Q2Y0_9PSEU
MSVASAERSALCSLFDELGPDAPTLCEGWQARHLAAHLVIRERRPDAAPGILVPALAGHTNRVQAGYERKDWAELVNLVRTGPPRFSPMSLGVVDQLVNSAEYLVHHEDLRRAQPGWEPRPADPARDRAALAAVTRGAKAMLRKSPVGVVLATPSGREITAKQGTPVVKVTGDPLELLLYAFGRDAVRVTFEGDETALATVKRGL